MRDRRCARAVRLACLVAACAAGGSAVGAAQMPRPSERDLADPRREQRGMMFREQTLRAAPKEAKYAKPTDPRAVELLVAQIKQDFERIQLIRRDLALATKAGKDVDFGEVAGWAKELNKRARRLHENLVGEEPKAADAGTQAEPTPVSNRVRNDVVVLCHTIDGFVENPALAATDTVDSQQAAAAIRDLQRIIDLSDAVRRSAERLSKAGGR